LYLQIVRCNNDAVFLGQSFIFLPEKNLFVLFMSTTTNMSAPPYQQFVYPPSSYAYDPQSELITMLHNQSLAQAASDATTRQGDSAIARDILKTLETQSLAQSASDATTRQSAADIARDILRAVDHNGSAGMTTTERVNAQLGSAIERTASKGMSTTERVNSQLATAVERNGANSMSTTERVNSQLAMAVERNGANSIHATERASNQVNSSVERNGGNIMTAIERVAGEGRLTTTVVDAASRQAANDSARDILRAVENTSAAAVGTTKDTYAGLLASIERNAGETRMAGAVAAGNTDFKLADVRHSVLNDVNRGINEVITAGTQNFNVLSKSVTDGAWEQRSAMANGFQNLGEEHMRTKYDISKTVDGHYASLMLEQQKLGQFFGSKADSHFAMNQLEMQKVKEGLACQAAQNFSISQLEAQKIRESITLQLADAKYEALKSTTFLADKIAECCCKTGDKIDNIDRDRLRDNLNVERTDNNLLKVLEFTDLLDGRRGGGHHGRGRRGHH